MRQLYSRDLTTTGHVPKLLALGDLKPSQVTIGL